MHEPLSQNLARLLEPDHSPDGLTLNRLLMGTDGRGLYLVIILLSLPFVVPVSIPGVSTVMGTIITLLAVRLAIGKPPRLPHVLGERNLSPEMQRTILVGSVKFLRSIERLVKPRRTHWLASRPARFANALLLAFMAVLLALPFPPFPPFTNSLPSYAIILLAASMMEEDGVTIWIGYAVALGAVIYLCLVAGALQGVFVGIYHFFQHLFA